MSKLDETLAKISKATEILRQPTELPKIDYSSWVYNIKPDIPKIEIDEKSTFAYQMQQQTDQIIAKSNEQIELLVKQNEQMVNNYQKLEDLYKIKEKELEEAKKDAKASKRNNIIMLILTIVSMLIAVAAWLLPNVLGGVS